MFGGKLLLRTVRIAGVVTVALGLVCAAPQLAAARSAPQAAAHRPSTQLPDQTRDGIVNFDSQYVIYQQGYIPFDANTSYDRSGRLFVAIAATAADSGDGYNQFVFFFIGTDYLGTDTYNPSTSLWLSGESGRGQIDVSYASYRSSDPLCCPSLRPVTITYSLLGNRVIPNGTPPGH